MSLSFPGQSAQYRQARDRLLEREAEMRRVTGSVAAARLHQRAQAPPQDFDLDRTAPANPPPADHRHHARSAPARLVATRTRPKAQRPPRHLATQLRECTRIRRRSCTARTAPGAVCTSTPRSPSWGTPSGPARHEAATARAFTSFLPAISQDALKKISREVHGWRLHRRTGLSFAELAKMINPVVAGWMQYYGRFYRSALYRLLERINAYLMRWIRSKYKRLRAARKARRSLRGITTRYPRMLAHWKWVTYVW